MSLKLSVVDQTPVQACHQSHEAPALTLELATLCDDLGYYRYWVAEHHNSIHFSNPCPEILVAALAARTRRIKVGSGGVMLNHYSPLKVAECFQMLATLHPGRIDLGIGRAPGGSDTATRALAYPYSLLNREVYEEKADMLRCFLHRDFSAQHPFSSIQPMRQATFSTGTGNGLVSDLLPDLWMLGSSGGSASLAGRLGYNLALARFIAPEQCDAEIFESWKRARQAANHSSPGEAMLAIACICADTKEEAEFRAGTAAYRKLSAQSGWTEPLLSPEEVMDRVRAMPRSQQAHFADILTSYTVGTVEQCHEEMNALARQFGVTELALVSVTHTQQERLESYRLLASRPL